MNTKLDKIRKFNTLTESSFLVGFTAAANYAKFLIDKGGIYALPLMPVLELIKAWLYWSKEHHDSPMKIGLNHMFNGLKVVASAAGVGFVLVGLSPIGFGIMIISTYVTAIRTLGKAIRSAIYQEENYQEKISKNLHKTAVAGMIATGFLLMSFFPPLAGVGALLALIAAGHVLLTVLPMIIGDKPLPDIKSVNTIASNPEKLENNLPQQTSVGFNQTVLYGHKQSQAQIIVENKNEDANKHSRKPEY